MTFPKFPIFPPAGTFWLPLYFSKTAFSSLYSSLNRLKSISPVYFKASSQPFRTIIIISLFSLVIYYSACSAVWSTSLQSSVFIMQLLCRIQLVVWIRVSDPSCLSVCLHHNPNGPPSPTGTGTGRNILHEGSLQGSLQSANNSTQLILSQCESPRPTSCSDQFYSNIYVSWEPDQSILVFSSCLSTNSTTHGVCCAVIRIQLVFYSRFLTAANHTIL